MRQTPLKSRFESWRHASCNIIVVLSWSNSKDVQDTLPVLPRHAVSDWNSQHIQQAFQFRLYFIVTIALQSL